MSQPGSTGFEPKPATFRKLPALALCALTTVCAGGTAVVAQEAATRSSRITTASAVRKTPRKSASVPTIDGIPSQDAQHFTATAYCLKGRTASGEPTRPGVIAADPRVLPLGSIVKINAGNYSGIYHVKDTGGKIRGNHIDVYVPTQAEAIRFGRRGIKIEVLRHGTTTWKRPAPPPADLTAPSVHTPEK